MNRAELWAKFYCAGMIHLRSGEWTELADKAMVDFELKFPSAFDESPVWRDIASAPKDDIIISLCTGCEVNEAHWVDGKWMDLRGNYIYPEYWMPLPGRPAKEAR